jgi:hypothetical protein
MNLMSETFPRLVGGAASVRRLIARLTLLWLVPAAVVGDKASGTGQWRQRTPSSALSPARSSGRDGVFVVWAVRIPALAR